MADAPPPLPAWIYRQSAALPFRWTDGELQVLLITNRSGTRWIIPKGIVEPGLTPQASAVKEAAEEAGVSGDPAEDSIGSYLREKWGGTCEVRVYPLLVDRELTVWPEASRRQRRWCSISDALDLVEEDGLRSVIGDLPRLARSPRDLAPELHPLRDPARLIYVLRHADAAPTGRGADFDRPLTREGLAACGRMLRYLSMADVSPDLVLCSAARRARETLVAITPAFESTPAVVHERTIYEAGADDLLDAVRNVGADVRRIMIVGHNPAAHSLVERLSSSGGSVARFPAGSLAILEYRGTSWGDLGGGSCTLHSVASPADLGDTAAL